MAILQGAMIGGYLLPEEEFKQIIKELFLETDNVLKLKSIINNALRNIKSKNIRAVYKNIEDFETNLLKNPPTSIMLITNLNSLEGNYKWAWNQDEKNVIRKSGKISFAKTVKNNLLEESLTNILSEHLLEMIRTIDSTELSNEEIDSLFINYKYQTSTHKMAVGARAHDDRNLKYIIYGNNPQYRGQIADAFLNHIGNMHKQLLIGDVKNINPFIQSVMQEEGGNFYQLLLDSTNNTPWYTGGDLILLDKTGQIISNIQLKTIINEKSSTIGKISSTTLFNQLLELKDFIEEDSIIDAEIFANKIYKMFTTSGIIEEVNEKIITDTVQYVKQSLKEN